MADDGHHYIAMEYIDGHGLSEEVRDEALKQDQTVAIAEVMSKLGVHYE